MDRGMTPAQSLATQLRVVTDGDTSAGYEAEEDPQIRESLATDNRLFNAMMGTAQG